MSDQFAKEKHSKRLHDDETHIKKRQKLLKAKSAYLSERAITKQPHRLNKVTGMNCGNPKCVLCMNPRRGWKERTVQEKSFDQTKKWTDDVLLDSDER